MQQTGLYIHIPFCVRKCQYCDFLSFASDEIMRQQYVEALVLEIQRAKERYPKNRYIDSVFLGGGTPSLLTVPQLSNIMSTIRDSFVVVPQAEVSMECNPGTVLKEELRQYYDLGINRLSFGVQSFQDNELRLLGRIHSAKDAISCMEWARQIGFQNINMDLMSGIPGQTLASYEKTLEQMCRLDPEHISAYSLIVEEGTPFYDMYGKEPPVSEEVDRVMYETTGSILNQYGYDRYEISNYAKPGFLCEHNLKYWSGVDYIGFGLGASGKIGWTRYKNETDIHVYISQIRNRQPVTYVEEELSKEDAMAEFFILGLRKTKGVSLLEFQNIFSRDAMEIYGDVILRMKQIGMMCQKGNQLWLSSQGVDVSNQILCEFL